MSFNLEIVRGSFDQAKSIADQVAEKFYEFLFEDYPETLELFKVVDMNAQKKALIQSLVYIVDHLEDQTRLAKFLSGMGRRHSQYGVTDNHYQLVGASLLKTFAHFFGENWTQELNEEWSKVYSFIAETMIKGAQTPVRRERSKGEAGIFQFELPDQIRSEIKVKVAEAFAAAVSAEVERAYAEEMSKLSDHVILSQRKAS